MSNNDFKKFLMSGGGGRKWDKLFMFKVRNQLINWFMIIN